MVYLVIWLERYKIGWFEEASQVGERMFLQLMQGAGGWHFLALSLAAGVGEELFFRGWLQSFLQIQLGMFGDLAPWLAIVLASMAFGIVHPVTKGYVVLAFLLGGLLGTAYYLSDNILVPIIAHTVYDFALMVRMFANARLAERKQ